MRNDEKSTELIDRYLDGKMQSDELTGFEKQIKSDSSLAEEVEIQRNIRDAIEVKDFKNMLSGIAEERRKIEKADKGAKVVKLGDKSDNESKNPFGVFAKVAAGLVLGLLALGLIMNFLDDKNNVDLTADRKVQEQPVQTDSKGTVTKSYSFSEFDTAPAQGFAGTNDSEKRVTKKQAQIFTDSELQNHYSFLNENLELYGSRFSNAEFELIYEGKSDRFILLTEGKYYLIVPGAEKEVLTVSED